MRPSKGKSRTFRRKHRRTPGGKTVLAYLKRNPKKASCSGCTKDLMGVPRLRPHELTNTAKTKKRPERPMGGMLCSSCSRRKIIEATRQ